MNPFSDEQLITSCTSGIQQHCRLLYERYKYLVAHLIRGYFRDTELIRDLTQDVFLKAFDKLKYFRAESSFKTWLSRIAVNHCKDHLRALARRSGKIEVSIDDPEYEGKIELPENITDPDPQDQFLKNELISKARAAVDQLDPEHKTVILLWIEGFAYSEIAERTDIDQNTVGSRIYYAKKKLGKILSSHMKGTNR